MKTRLFTACVLVAGVLGAAPLSAQHAQNPLVIDSMAGPDLFQFYCAPCHGRDGRGRGPVAAVLKTPPADLTKIAEKRAGTFPRADIIGFVSEGSALIPAHGTIDMPVWGPIFRSLDSSEARNRARIDNLVSYLESIQAK
jgi:mono/diheme cytochrome c family protein